MKKIIILSIFIMLFFLINGCVSLRYASQLEKQLDEERMRTSNLEKELEEEKKWTSDLENDVRYLQIKLNSSQSHLSKCESTAKGKDEKVTSFHKKVDTLNRIIKLDDTILLKYREFVNAFIAVESSENPEQVYSSMVIDKRFLNEIIQLEKKRKRLIGR